MLAVDGLEAFVHECHAPAVVLIVDSGLTGEVLVESGGLHADHPSNLMEVQGGYPLAPHDHTRGGQNRFRHFPAISLPAFLRGGWFLKLESGCTNLGHTN